MLDLRLSARRKYQPSAYTVIVVICCTSLVRMIRILRCTITPPIPDGPFAEELPKAFEGLGGASPKNVVENAEGERPLALDTRLDDLDTDGRLSAEDSGTAAVKACGGSRAAFCWTETQSLSQHRCLWLGDTRTHSPCVGFASTTAKPPKANFATLLSLSNATR